MPRRVTMLTNLYAFLRTGFAHRLDRPFLISDEFGTLSYRSLDRMSARVAALLRHRGLRPGDRLVAQTGKTPLTVALYLGCLRAGVVYVPLNTAYTANEIDYFVSDAEPGLVVMSNADDAARVDAADSLWLDADDRGSFRDALDQCTPDDELADGRPQDVVAMLYTSGTTGRSKGALLTLENLASNAATLVEVWGWQDDDVLLHALPVFHVHGLFVALHCALLGGSPVLFHARFEVTRVREDLPKATVMMGVPTFYTRLLAVPEFGVRDCEHMRLFISGSAPLPAEQCLAFEKRSGHRILERYGMTEAGMITSNPLHGERLAGTVGYPLPGVELRVVDETGAVSPADSVGEVEIRGPNVFAGYWRMPEKTAAEFRDDGFFLTGDLGRLSADGRLTLVGRAKDLIISGGYNIYPKEIETCLDALDSVRESAVIGVPHADLGEAVVAVIVPADHATPSEASVLAGVGEALARFKQPRRVVFVTELPRNAMGKVRKQALRETYADALK